MKPYGCHSKPRESGYWAQDGSYVTFEERIVQKAAWIPDTMTKECNYRQTTPNDPRCEGCTCP